MTTSHTASVLADTGRFCTRDLVPEDKSESSIVRYRALVAIEWIKEDIHRGVLPSSVTSFSELHDYTDANMYLLDENHPDPRVGSFWEWDELDVQGVCDRFNATADIVNDWLATRTYIRQNPG